MKKQVHGGDVYRHPQAIDFSANMNPLGVPASVIAAATESLSKIERYPDVFKNKLRAALAIYEGVDSEHIICGNGAAELIFALTLALKPRKALLPIPTFAEYEQALRAVDCDIKYYQMVKDFTLDEGILDYIDEEQDIMFICNPNNPTGFVVDSDLMTKIIKKCQVCQVFLVVDECFQDFIEEADVHTLKGTLTADSPIFLLKAFTKRYAMPGIRLGYGLCQEAKVLAKMNQVMQPWNISIPAEAAGIAALQETAYVKKAQQLVQVERKYLMDELQKLPLTVYHSQANYIFFKGPDNLYDDCIKQNILIRDCQNYQGLSKGYYRIAVRTHAENEKLVAVFMRILDDKGE